MKIKSLVLAIAMATVVSGCSSGVNIPSDLSQDLDRDNATRLYEKAWKKAEPPITFVPVENNIAIHKANDLPKSVTDSKISIEFNTSAKVSALVPLFKQRGMYLIIPDAELLNQNITLFEFEGKFGDYITALENAYGFSFNFKEGSIVIAEKLSDFILKIPQNEDVAKQIAKDIKAFGGDNVSYSLNAGSIYYKATKKTNIMIAEHLDRLSLNTSLISMQVAVINVQIDRNVASGIDWSKFNIGFGASASAPSSNSTSNNSDSSSDSSDSSDGSSGSSSNSNTSDKLGTSLSSMLGAGTVTGQASNLLLYKGDFSLSAVVDFLSSYGKANAAQSLIMKTLSGNKVEMSVGDKIPYIDELNSTKDTSTDSESDSVSVSYLDTGTKINLTPWFDNQDQLVTINFNMEVSSLTKWVSLNAGKSLGYVDQPQTREQKFSDVVKLSAGKSVIIGGISYDEYSDDRNAPFFAEKAGIAHKEESLKKNATYILIRPTVTIFGKR